MSIIVKGHDGGVLRRFRLPQTGPSVLPTLGAGALCDPEGFTVTLLTGNLAEGTYEFTPTSVHGPPLLTDYELLGQPLPEASTTLPHTLSLSAGGRAFEYVPTAVLRWEAVAGVSATSLDDAITQYRDAADKVERRWQITDKLVTPLNSEAAISGAMQSQVGELCSRLLQQQQQTLAAHHAAWEPQPPSEIMQGAIAYALQQGGQRISSFKALAQSGAPSADAEASRGSKRKMDMALLVAAPATPAAQQSTERVGGLSPAGVEAGPSNAASTTGRPEKQRCICVGELKRAGKLMIGQDQAVDLVAAWNDRQHAYHSQATAVIKQQHTYMILWQLCFGFISCYFGTWLVYCPPDPAEARRKLYVSRAYLAADRSPEVTALAAVAWVQHQALGSIDAPVAAHPDPPLSAAGLSDPADDVGSPPDDGARSDPASEYQPTSQQLREADASSSDAGQGSTLLKASACAPSNSLRLYDDLCMGSEGRVMRGAYGGADAVVKLLGPDSAGLAAFTREAAVLAAFAPLAGQAAPRLLGAGHIRAGVHFIATAYIDGGQPLSSLQDVPPHVATAVLDAYRRLRELQPRFVHGDLHLRNIMLLNSAGGSDTHVTCIFLDFGQSRLDASAAEQQAEKKLLRSLLRA